MPTEAEEDWIIAVNTAPASTPSTGFENMVSRFEKAGESASGATAPDICSMPNISTAKPRKMPAVSFLLSCLLNISIAMPIKASTGVKADGLSIVMYHASPLMPVSDRSQLVTDVPTFAPMMM